MAQRKTAQYVLELVAVPMAVTVASLTLRCRSVAVLVADQNQSNQDCPNDEGQHCSESLDEAQLGVVHLWQAVGRADMQVHPAAECKDEADDRIVDWRCRDDDGSDDDAQTAREVGKQGLYRRQGNAWPGQDYEVCNFLRQLVQDRASGYAPAECISTDLEGGANEEAVTKVVEEVSNQNCT